MTKLYLIPTAISPDTDNAVLLPEQLLEIKHLQHFIVETAKTARQHIKQLKLNSSLQDLNIQELNKHNQNLNELIKPLLNENDVGLISDCGVPAIADPGSQIVNLCHKNGITVIPLVGPSSILLALMASGVNGQSFAFNGYLPIEQIARIAKIKHLQELIIKYNQSQIIIEAPFRNQQLLDILIKTLSSNIILSIAINLMSKNENIISKEIKDWQNLKTLPNIHKQEVVFIIGK
ncbi:MAG TPA: SAM-dependent methyltransferase [Burkholderiales bacterium]|nr:SAM-dependent methyltransferase [Burkholderiales bacterium]